MRRPIGNAAVLSTWACVPDGTPAMPAGPRPVAGSVGTWRASAGRDAASAQGRVVGSTISTRILPPSPMRVSSVQRCLGGCFIPRIWFRPSIVRANALPTGSPCRLVDHHVTDGLPDIRHDMCAPGLATGRDTPAGPGGITGGGPRSAVAAWIVAGRRLRVRRAATAGRCWPGTSGVWRAPWLEGTTWTFRSRQRRWNSAPRS